MGFVQLANLEIECEGTTLKENKIGVFATGRLGDVGYDRELFSVVQDSQPFRTFVTMEQYMETILYMSYKSDVL